MRFHLSLFLAVVSFTAFAADPEFDIRKAEDQFTQATQDAQVIDRACAQTRTDRKACYQRVSTATAKCREQLQPQYFDTRSAGATVDRDAYLAALNTCVREQTK